jgi:hypothetical protein
LRDSIRRGTTFRGECRYRFQAFGISPAGSGKWSVALDRHFPINDNVRYRERTRSRIGDLDNASM